MERARKKRYKAQGLSQIEHLGGSVWHRDNLHT